MPGRVARKWRPPLWLVLGGVLAALLSAPLVAVVGLRLLAARLDLADAAWVLAGLGLAAAAALGWLLWRLLWRPVTLLAERARLVQAGASGALDPLPHYGTQELGALGSAMLAMAETLADRAAAAQSYTDHATHELKTPVAAILAAAELLEGGGPADPRLVGSITAAARRIEGVLGGMQAAAAARAPSHRGSTRLAEVAAGLVAAFPELTLHWAGRDIALPLAAGGLQIVLTQLLGNARAAGAAAVWVEARPGPDLLVRDDGPGVSPGNAARIFAPFFTTRRDRGGTGMGLTIVAHVLDQVGARIGLEPGGGAGETHRSGVEPPPVACRVGETHRAPVEPPQTHVTAPNRRVGETHPLAPPGAWFRIVF